MPQRKQYTPAFKLEIAKLMVEQNYTLAQACEVAGAGPTAVKRWRQQTLAEQSGKLLPNRRALTPEMQEIQQLKQRIKQLEVERDILKKASAFFAREMR